MIFELAFVLGIVGAISMYLAYIYYRDRQRLLEERLDDLERKRRRRSPRKATVNSGNP